MIGFVRAKIDWHYSNICKTNTKVSKNCLFYVFKQLDKYNA